VKPSTKGDINKRVERGSCELLPVQIDVPRPQEATCPIGTQKKWGQWAGFEPQERGSLPETLFGSVISLIRGGWSRCGEPTSLAHPPSVSYATSGG